MKKFLLSLLALVWVSAAAFAGEYTIQFKSTGGSDSNASFDTATSIENVVESGTEYLSSISAVDKAYQGKDGYGMKLSSSSVSGTITFALSDAGKKKITKIVATLACFSNNKDLAEAALSINGVSQDVRDANLLEYTFDYPEATLAETLKFDATKRVYVQKLVVTYEDETPEQPQPSVVEYTAPTGQTYANNYLEVVSTTGANTDIHKEWYSHPGTIYNVLENQVAAAPGQEFTLNLNAYSAGPANSTTAYEDIRFCEAYIFVDWYGTGEFTHLKTYGNHSPSGNTPHTNMHIYGNYDDVMVIAHALTVPADVTEGTAARIRVIYQNAWTNLGNGNDPNATNLDKGIAYDIVVNVEAPAPTMYTVTITEPEDGALEVLANGTAINSGDQVEAGTELTFTATPAEGYEFTGLYINDVVESINDPYTVNGDVNILATFSSKYYDVTYTTPENGTLTVLCDGVDVPSGDRLAHGSVLTITATPNEGYELAAITVNDVALEGNTYTLTENAAIAATFNEVVTGPTYETYPADRKSTHGERYTTKLTFTCGETTQEVTDLQTGLRQAIYQDAVAQVVTFDAGSTVTITPDFHGVWMHSYLWIDYNNDGTFTAELDENDMPTATSELVGFGNYNSNPDDSSKSWHSSNGDVWPDGGSNGVGNANTPFSFTIPANLADGDYRGRFIVDWNAIDPNPSPDRAANKMETNGGIVADFTIHVNGAATPTYTITFAEPENGTLTVLNGETAINSGDQVEENTELTITATPAEGYQLATLTVNDAAFEGSTLTVTEDVTIAATFTAVPVVEQRASFTIPETAGTSATELYTFRFDDAPLGSHTNGTVDDSDLRSRNFTYSAWIRIKSATGKPVMGNIQSDFSHACGAFLVTYNDGKLNFNGRNADASSTNFKDVQGSETTDEGTAVNEWVFVSVVADQANNTATLYKNGKAISSYTTGYGIGLLTDKASFFIADNGASVEVSEVQLWNKALTADELKDAYAFSYNANAVPENLVAYYRAGDFVEGSTTDLRNLGTEASTPGQMIKGRYYLQGGWNPQFLNQAAQDITVDGEGHVYKTVAVTAIQPEEEGNSFKITGANGRAIETEANLYEKLTVVPTLAEGVQLNGVKVVEGENTTVYTLDQMPFYANGDITVSLDFGTVEPAKYTVTFAAPENGTLAVFNGETAINSGDQVEENTVLTITATPNEGYELATLTVNDAALEGNTITVTEDVTIAATFTEAAQPGVEYTAPSGQSYKDNYLTSIASTGAKTDISVSYDAHPGIYTVLSDAITALPGKNFHLNLVANSLGEGSSTTVREDLRFCVGYIFADWYGTGDFTLVQTYGLKPPTNNVYGNYDEVMNIDHLFTVPADVAAGTAARIRVVYQNAWQWLGAGVSTLAGADPNATNLDKGIAYDIVVNVVERDSYTLVANVTGGTATVEVNGEGFQDLPAEGLEIAKGAKVAVRFARQASHYELSSFEVNGVDDLEHMASLSQTIYSIPTLDQDYTFDVVYTPRKHTIIVMNPTDADVMESWYGELQNNQGEPLDMDTENSVEVEEGSTVYFSIQPPLEIGEVEYELAGVTDNGAEVFPTECFPWQDGYMYLLSNVTEDHTLVVKQQASGIIAISSDANNALKFENGILTIAAEDAVIEVADINGRVIRKAQTTAMEVSDLVNGVYVAKASTADATYTLKFIKL
jgi:hypothetical protein